MTLSFLHYIFTGAAGLIVGGLMVGMVVRSRCHRLGERKLAAAQSEMAVLQARLEVLREAGEGFEQRANRWRGEAADYAQRLTELRVQAAERETMLDLERKQAAEKIALLKEAREQLDRDFQILAQRILDEKGGLLVARHQESLNQLIAPLRVQIGEFKRRVEDVYDRESRDRIALQTEISQLMQLNRQMAQEALNLTKALKGDSKVRGNWGEMVLARVLEASGLQRGREYDVQVVLRGREDRRYLPDAIVRLPEGKDVVIDAKVSLNAYDAYHSAEEFMEKEGHLSAHIESMRAHIRALGAKGYEDLEGVCSLDFILMFVPIEGAFLVAVEKDGGLFTEALERNIVVVTPSTLLVTLRIIQNIWRYENRDRNALEIAQKAGALYDKCVGFVDSLQQVGQLLDRARGAYQSAHDRLIGGRGNLVRRTEELKRLGAKTTKAFPNQLVEKASDTPADDGPTP